MKFYIDSRDRVAGSNEDFTWAPPICLDLDEPHVALLDTTLIPNSFPSVVENYNDKLYIYEAQPFPAPNNTLNVVERVVTIAPGRYSSNTLPSAVETALNAGRILTNPYTVAFNTLSSKLTITNSLEPTADFHIYPTKYLKKYGFPGVTAYRDAGWVCGFLGEALLSQSNGAVTGDSTINVATHHNLFIRSSNLGAGQQMFGPHGASDIVKRVIMTAPPNSLNVDTHSTAYDVIKVNAGSYSSFDFRLCDYQGNVVDLRGQPWSFSLCLHPT